MKKYSLILICLGFLSTINITLKAQFVQEREINEEDNYVEDQEMNVVVVDHSNGSPLMNDVIIRGYNPRKVVTFEDVRDTVFNIKNYRLYTVSAIRKGYMYYNKKFWPDEKKVHFQRVNLKPLELGLKTDIRDIYFLGNETKIYHKSKPAIEELVAWMKLNKTVSIRIIGHVNGPNNDYPQRVYNKASLERAEAVVDFMISLGVSKNRLEAAGVGNSEMVYKDPQTNWENEANRRVEVELIKL